MTPLLSTAIPRASLVNLPLPVPFEPYEAMKVPFKSNLSTRKLRASVMYTASPPTLENSIDIGVLICPGPLPVVPHCLMYWPVGETLTMRFLRSIT